MRQRILNAYINYIYLFRTLIIYLLKLVRNTYFIDFSVFNREVALLGDRHQKILNNYQNVKLFGKTIYFFKLI